MNHVTGLPKQSLSSIANVHVHVLGAPATTGMQQSPPPRGELPPATPHYLHADAAANLAHFQDLAPSEARVKRSAFASASASAPWATVELMNLGLVALCDDIVPPRPVPCMLAPLVAQSTMQLRVQSPATCVCNSLDECMQAAAWLTSSWVSLSSPQRAWIVDAIEAYLFGHCADLAQTHAAVVTLAQSTPPVVGASALAALVAVFQAKCVRTAEDNTQLGTRACHWSKHAVNLDVKQMGAPRGSKTLLCERAFALTDNALMVVFSNDRLVCVRRANAASPWCAEILPHLHGTWDQLKLISENDVLIKRKPTSPEQKKIPPWWHVRRSPDGQWIATPVQSDRFSTILNQHLGEPTYMVYQPHLPREHGFLRDALPVVVYGPGDTPERAKHAGDAPWTHRYLQWHGKELVLHQMTRPSARAVFDRLFACIGNVSHAASRAMAPPLTSEQTRQSRDVQRRLHPLNMRLETALATQQIWRAAAAWNLGARVDRHMFCVASMDVDHPLAALSRHAMGQVIDDQGHSLIYHALRLGDPGSAEMHIRRGTPFHIEDMEIAAKQGALKVLNAMHACTLRDGTQGSFKITLDEIMGKAVATYDARGCTLLMYALAEGDRQAAQALIRYPQVRALPPARDAAQQLLPAADVPATWITTTLRWIVDYGVPAADMDVVAWLGQGRLPPSDALAVLQQWCMQNVDPHPTADQIMRDVTLWGRVDWEKLPHHVPWAQALFACLPPVLRARWLARSVLHRAPQNECLIPEPLPVRLAMLRHRAPHVALDRTDRRSAVPLDRILCPEHGMTANAAPAFVYADPKNPSLGVIPNLQRTDAAHADELWQAGVRIGMRITRDERGVGSTPLAHPIASDLVAHARGASIDLRAVSQRAFGDMDGGQRALQIQALVEKLTAFYQGLITVCPNPLLRMLSPFELDQVINGAR